jgi:hypothetical protein
MEGENGESEMENPAIQNAQPPGRELETRARHDD